jgi:hypothetical protein
MCAFQQPLLLKKIIALPGTGNIYPATNTGTTRQLCRWKERIGGNEFILVAVISSNIIKQKSDAGLVPRSIFK